MKNARQQPSKGKSLEFLAQIRGGSRRIGSGGKHKCYRRTISGYEVRWSEQQGPTFSSSRGNTLRERHWSNGAKDGGIKCGQSYGAGSAEDVVSERRAVALHRKSGTKSSLLCVFSASLSQNEGPAPTSTKRKANKGEKDAHELTIARHLAPDPPMVEKSL